jgi:hypothetical protein
LETQKIKFRGTSIFELYLTQPPITMVELKSEKNGNGILGIKSIKKASGVTLGDVVIAVSLQVSPNPEYPINVDSLRVEAGRRISQSQPSESFRISLLCKGLDAVK